MRRMLVTGFVMFAVLGGWASAADVRQPSLAKLLMTGTMAPAPQTAPDVLVKTVTAEVIAILRQDQDIQAGDPAKVADLVETRILPHFDFARMTQVAVARNWRLASPEQQQALTTEFKSLLVRTYSTALSGYRDQAIEYKPLWMAPGATEVTVKSAVKQPGAGRTTIDYDMEKTPAGWKVYDIKVAGVSLITIYRSNFARSIRDGGVDGLIQSLSARNRQTDSEPRSHENGAQPFLFIIYAVIPSVFRSGR